MENNFRNIPTKNIFSNPHFAKLFPKINISKNITISVINTLII